MCSCQETHIRTLLIHKNVSKICNICGQQIKVHKPSNDTAFETAHIKCTTWLGKTDDSGPVLKTVIHSG